MYFLFLAVFIDILDISVYILEIGGKMFDRVDTLLFEDGTLSADIFEPDATSFLEWFFALDARGLTSFANGLVHFSDFFFGDVEIHSDVFYRHCYNILKEHLIISVENGDQVYTQSEETEEKWVILVNSIMWFICYVAFLI